MKERAYLGHMQLKSMKRGRSRRYNSHTLSYTPLFKKKEVLSKPYSSNLGVNGVGSSSSELRT